MTASFAAKKRIPSLPILVGIVCLILPGFLPPAKRLFLPPKSEFETIEIMLEQELSFIEAIIQFFKEHPFASLEEFLRFLMQLLGFESPDEPSYIDDNTLLCQGLENNSLTEMHFVFNAFDMTTQDESSSTENNEHSDTEDESETESTDNEAEGTNYSEQESSTDHNSVRVYCSAQALIYENIWDTQKSTHVTALVPSCDLTPVETRSVQRLSVLRGGDTPYTLEKTTMEPHTSFYCRKGEDKKDIDTLVWLICGKTIQPARDLSGNTGIYPVEFYGRKYIVKTVNPDMMKKFDMGNIRDYRKYLKLEKDVLMQLNHENIVTLAAFFFLTYPPFGATVMVFHNKGKELHWYLKKEFSKVQSHTFHIARQLASALSYIHQRGLIYGDLKDHNILLSDPDHGRVVLIDFGFCGTQEQREDLKLTTSGTPGWFPPENGKIDSSARDMYYYGLLLFRLIFNTSNLSRFDEIETAMELKPSTVRSMILTFLYEENPDFYTVSQDRLSSLEHCEDFSLVHVPYIQSSREFLHLLSVMTTQARPDLRLTAKQLLELLEMHQSYHMLR